MDLSTRALLNMADMLALEDAAKTCLAREAHCGGAKPRPVWFRLLQPFREVSPGPLATHTAMQSDPSPACVRVCGMYLK